MWALLIGSGRQTRPCALSERPLTVMKAFVTGATGFLGGHLVARLAALGWSVTAVGRNRQRGQELATSSPLVTFVPLDLTESTAVVNACAGHDLIFHCAAKSDAWGATADFWVSNVWATANIIRATQHHQIGRLIHVSTPSLYFYNQPRLNVRESDPLPPQFSNDYVRTKWAADKLIQEAYQRQGLPVVTLRPRAIFGPGDTALVPRLVRALAAGRLPQIGTGETWVDLTYVANVVEALLLAATAELGLVHGRVFNITNGEPVNLWAVIAQLAADLGYPPPTKRLPYRVAWLAATLLEASHRRFLPHTEPLLTRYAVGVLAQSRTLNIEASQTYLGYQPTISFAEGYRRYIESCQQ